jgi:hypothetical protein
VHDLTVAIGISSSMDGSLFYHRGLAHYAKGSLGAGTRSWLRFNC